MEPRQFLNTRNLKKIFGAYHLKEPALLYLLYCYRQRIEMWDNPYIKRLLKKIDERDKELSVLRLRTEKQRKDILKQQQIIIQLKQKLNP